MKEKLATLSFSDGTPSVDFPVFGGTIGPDVIDVRSLYAKTGKFTYDPGFMSTASCRSNITYIDGDEGILLYRGYPIEQLAEKCDFLEVAYLILNGELPNKPQKQEFDDIVTSHTMVHDQMNFFFRGFRRDAHPMAVLCGVVGALSAFYHDSIDIHDERSRDVSAFRLIAKLPTITAMAYKYTMGQPFMYPKNSLSYTENFLYMMFGNPCEDYKPNPVVSRAMDRILILHADHEQNASTSTVRLAGSTGANPVCLHFRRNCQPVGAGARRRQRSRAENARRNRRRQEHPGLHQAGEGEGRPCHADGLRPPRLQEL